MISKTADHVTNFSFVNCGPSRNARNIKPVSLESLYMKVMISNQSPFAVVLMVCLIPSFPAESILVKNSENSSIARKRQFLNGVLPDWA